MSERISNPLAWGVFINMPDGNHHVAPIGPDDNNIMRHRFDLLCHCCPKKDPLYNVVNHNEPGWPGVADEGKSN